MQMTRVRAMSLLAVLLIQMGLVSLTKPLSFLGRRKSLDLLNVAISWRSIPMASVKRNKKGAAMSEIALQAAKGIPSRPGEEFDDEFIASRKRSG